ncbi:MAG: cation:proton antiporter [Lysobacteraceae bacterium]
MIEALGIGAALLFGLLARAIGLPPLVGFLAAGFALHAADERWDWIPDRGIAAVGHLAHIGVLLLLFTVGLKLKIGQIAQPAVVGGGLLHGAVVVALFAPVLVLAVGIGGTEALLVAIALSFSSTVLAAKMLEGKRELSAFYGRVAIGILIVQDLVALAALALWGGKSPSPWAVLPLGLPLLRPLLFRLLDRCGHDELLVLAGLGLALMLGGMGFAAFGVSGELGALLVGMLVAGHPRARELGNTLWAMKEVFLVAFFLQIGLAGLPTASDWAVAGLLLLALPFKAALFFGLLLAFRLRARNAFLAALALGAYSEFGLIVAVGVPGLEAWLTPIAMAVALSFAVAAPLNRSAQALYERFEPALARWQRQARHPDEIPPALGHARALVFGMGRTGTAAYDTLGGALGEVVGLDADPYRVREHQQSGRQVVMADAEDGDFWRSVDLGGMGVAVLAMDAIEAKRTAARQLRARGFRGPIVAHALFADHVALLRADGVDDAHLTLHEAGRHLGEQALRRLLAEGGASS